MEKEMINEYANIIGLTANLSDEFLDKLKLTHGFKRFIAEKKIRVISEELDIDLEYYLLKLLNIFDYSDIHEECVTENEMNSVLPVILEIFNLLAPVGAKGKGRTAYGTAEERTKKLKDALTRALGSGATLNRSGPATSYFSRKGTGSLKTRDYKIKDPHKIEHVKKALRVSPSGVKVTAPKIHKI